MRYKTAAAHRSGADGTVAAPAGSAGNKAIAAHPDAGANRVSAGGGGG
ncbi:MAG: hypothetical protein IT574_00460 [Candidatus Aureabacteria bacterium]|nr:hypothetical protein [Candidatus Auribacterota bacterium]NLW95068.1 hypothetical protein [Chlamydiota bacterium]HOE26188.1 hypothetical protein [bacterium]HQM53839.1 hypothetical protein [bacterium]